MTKFTFSQIETLMQPFFNRPKESAPQTLAQRTLDRRRAKKIGQYLTNGLSQPDEFYILLPIVVTLDIPEWESYDFQSVDLGLPGVEDLGLLSLPDETSFWIPDGQHRSFGAIQALLESPGLVEAETIGVMLIPDSGGKKRHRIFLDANQHGIRPNKSIITLFDHRDPHSEIARAVLMSVDVFRDRTALEATNINPKSADFFTMNALRESCRSLLLDAEGDLEQQAIDFWQRVAEHHPTWKQLQFSADPMLRQTTISFNAITLNALAIVGRTLMQHRKIEQIANLDRVNWQLDNVDWEGVCKFNGRIVKNNTTIQALADYILARLED